MIVPHLRNLNGFKESVYEINLLTITISEYRYAHMCIYHCHCFHKLGYMKLILIEAIKVSLRIKRYRSSDEM